MKVYPGENKDLALTALAACEAKRSYQPEYEKNVAEEEVIGLMLAHHFDWDGIPIMRAFFEALEDANFHREAAVVEGWMNAMHREATNAEAAA